MTINTETSIANDRRLCWGCQKPTALVNGICGYCTEVISGYPPNGALPRSLCRMCGETLEIDGPPIHSECDYCIKAMRDIQIALDQLAILQCEPPIDVITMRSAITSIVIEHGQKVPDDDGSATYRAHKVSRQKDGIDTAVIRIRGKLERALEQNRRR